MKILLTGPNGQIGWELQYALGACTATIIPANRALIDLARPRAMRAAIREIAPDVIINAAGHTGVDLAEEEPQLAMQINGHAPGVLAEEAARSRALLIHYSTDYVFDGRKRTPYQPGDAPNPLNAYGLSKLAGEEAIDRSGARALILRTCWVYSFRRSNFLLTMLRLAARRGEIRVVDDQIGCPSWSRLIAQGTVRILESLIHDEVIDESWRAGSRTYHLACAGDASWFEFASWIFRCADLDPPPNVQAISEADYPAAARRPRYSVLDCEQTRRDFGVELVRWKDAVRDAVQQHRAEASVNSAAHAGRDGR